MAESAVQSAAETLTYFLRQKDFYLSHVDEWVRTLRNKLKAILKDVDGMRRYNYDEGVQLIEVAKNTKNVIDSFIFKIAEQRGETSAGLMSYQSTFNSGIKDKPAIEDLGKKIFDLKTRLDEILSNRSQYGIHNIQPSREASTSSNLSQIREKELEIENMNRKNRELVERTKQVAMEAQSWHHRARYNESVVNVLNSNLKQAIAQGADAASSFDHNTIVGGPTKPITGKNAGLKEQMTCKACKIKEVSILLLPCRHLCLCKDCEVFIDICPVCQSRKTASVQVYMS